MLGGYGSFRNGDKVCIGRGGADGFLNWEEIQRNREQSGSDGLFLYMRGKDLVRSVMIRWQMCIPFACRLLYDDVLDTCTVVFMFVSVLV